ncbi:MAG: VPLPA-CTERM sorting domain-containing protein [Rhodobacteraceae bacterium]|nr:VPLPA-CTERM sorting domain-containing protein [Paracoccaceae bacterium]
MRKSVFRSIVIASALAFSVGMASASTVSLKFDGGTANGGVSFKSVPTVVSNPPRSSGAYGFNMVDVTAGGSVLGKFVAWCLDLEHFLAPNGVATPYMVTKTPFSNSYGLSRAEMKLVQSVFDANFAGVKLNSNTQAAAFQVALWNALYDGDAAAGRGTFAIKSDESGEEIIKQANKYLEAAKTFDGKKVWNLTFLESKDKSTRQNLVTVTPVPVPAAAGLMLLALGGLAAVGRRRRAA